jgi:hypothetical protein
MYCPSTPMLNRPALKATATASAEKMSGVAFSSTTAKSCGRAVANRHTVTYTVTGSSS